MIKGNFIIQLKINKIILLIKYIMTNFKNILIIIIKIISTFNQKYKLNVSKFKYDWKILVIEELKLIEEK